VAKKGFPFHISDPIFLTLIMPITSPLSLNPIRQQEFAQLDYVLTEGTEDYERHLRCLLGASPLRAIQWINLARKRVQFTSLIR
jgi:hypothetical protein